MATWDQRLVLDNNGPLYPSNAPKYAFVIVERIGQQYVRVSENGAILPSEMRRLGLQGAPPMRRGEAAQARWRSRFTEAAPVAPAAAAAAASDPVAPAAAAPVAPAAAAAAASDPVASAAAAAAASDSVASAAAAATSPTPSCVSDAAADPASVSNDTAAAAAAVAAAATPASVQ